MSLDVDLRIAACSHCTRDEENIFSANVTHNLTHMADAAGIYKACWRPEEIGITMASQLIEPLRAGLAWLLEHEDEARKHNPENGWGDYEGFVTWVREYLAACEAHPTASVHASR